MNAEGKRVLLFVDDEKHLREIYERYFVERGYDVRLADDGSIAVTRVREGDVDLVVMDLHMPHVDGDLGIEVLREIAPDLPIVVVSGHLSDHTIEEGIPGTVRLIRKPIPLAALEREIAGVLGKA